MKRVLYLFFLLFGITACGENGAGTNVVMEDSIGNKDTAIVKGSPEKPEPVYQANVQVDSVIHLKFAEGSDSITVHGHLEHMGGPVICFLPVTRGKTLTGSVIPGKPGAAVRFSQLFKPDGESDGPFSRTIKYDLEQKGTYKIYIGINMMAGDLMATDFTANFKVE